MRFLILLECQVFEDFSRFSDGEALVEEALTIRREEYSTILISFGVDTNFESMVFFYIAMKNRLP